MRTFTHGLLQKVLALVPLTPDVTEVYVSTMTNTLSEYYGDMEETLNHLKSIKLKSYTGENVSNFCAPIIVDYEGSLTRSDVTFHKCDNKGHIKSKVRYNGNIYSSNSS